MKLPGVSDIIIFSRITGAALLVCGYLIAGLYLGRWFQTKGYPDWTMLAALLLGLIAALLSGWYEIKSILAMIRRERDEAK